MTKKARLTLKYSVRRYGLLDKKICATTKGVMRPTIGSTIKGTRILTLFFRNQHFADSSKELLQEEFGKKLQFQPERPYALLNWPPSRGPKPIWMLKKPRDIIPAVEVEIKQRPKHKLPSKAAVLKAVREAQVAVFAYSKCMKKRKRPIKITALHNRIDRQKNLDLRCSAHVETVSGLTLKQALGTIAAWDPVRKSWVRDRAGCKLVAAPGGGWAILPTRPFRVHLTYPLSVDVWITVKPYTRDFGPSSKRERTMQLMSGGYLLWQVARFYKREIYRKHRKYGVWGHDIGDLHFETIHIRGNECEIGIGS